MHQKETKAKSDLAVRSAQSSRIFALQLQTQKDTEQIRSQKTALEQTGQELEKLHAALRSKAKEIEAIGAALDTEKANVDDLQRNLGRMVDERDGKRKEIEELETKVEQADKMLKQQAVDLSAAQGQAAQEEKRARHQEMSTQEATDRAEAAEVKVEEHAKRIRQLEEAIEGLKSPFTQALEAAASSPHTRESAGAGEDTAMKVIEVSPDLTGVVSTDF